MRSRSSEALRAPDLSIDRKKPPRAVAEEVGDRAAKELRQSASRFAEFVGNANLLSVVLAPDASIVYCNDALLALTGRTRESVEGRSWFECFRVEPFDELRIAFAELLKNNPDIWHIESHMATPTGERRLIRWNNAVVRSPMGEIIGTASVGEDLTAIRDAQETIGALQGSRLRDPSRATAHEMVALIDELQWRPEEAALPFLQLLAEHCAQLADECGDHASGPAVGRHIRMMFKL